MTTNRWKIDPSHSGIHFSVRHMVISKVRGAFQRWQGLFEFDPERPAESKVSVHIEAASLDTREAQRDAHLRSPDFFDVEKHPTLDFESTKVEKLDDERYRVTGDLTIRGVTRPVTLEAEYLGAGKDPWGNQRIGFQARASINRSEFGLTWNQVLEAGGVLVGDKIEITLDVQAIKDQAAERAA